MSQRFPPHRGYAQRPSHPSRFEHSDRWNGRSSQRSRSPPTRDPRDRRDSRDFAPPRDLPLDRAQRYLRDGPLSAGSNPPDPRYPPAPYGRGRGRPGDWDFRGRNRLPDERDAFRRSPSRGPRRERQGSVDSRDYDRRDERRDEFRDHRDEEWRYRRQDFVRRDPPPRIDSRHASDARSDSMPSPVERIGRQPSPHRRQSPVDKRDYETPRRPSMIDHASKDGRRDSERSEVIRQQRDRSPDRTQTRQAEETSSVAVPQFGFIPPVLATPVKAPVSPVPSSKTIPTAPRAQLSAIVPTGPKAERLPDRPITTTKDPVPTAVTEDTKPKEMLSLPVAVNVQPATSPPLSEPSIHESPSAFRTQSLEASPSFTVKQLIPPSAPTGPRSSSQPLGRASSAGPPVRDASPSASMANIPPLGPRGSIPQLPKGLPDNIPIGPRAMVMNRAPPTAPRNHRQQATSWQWRPNEPTVPPRAPSIPAKRDANGEEKERTPVPERLFESARVGSSAPYSMDVRKPSDSPVKTFLTLGGYPEKLKLAANEDIRMTDVPSKGSPISPGAGKGYYSSDDDEDQGLTEEDFKEQAEQYKQRRAELEAQREIFQRKHRATTPLQELDKGNAILAIVDEMRLPASPEPSPAPIADTTMTEEVPTKSPTPEEVPSPMRSASEAPVVASAPRELTPEMSKSPDFEYLPYLPERPPTPISNPEQLEDVADDDLQNLIDAEIQEMEHEDDENQTAREEQFRSLYYPWKRNAVILDREREIVETEVTQSKIEIDIPEPSVEQPVTPLPTSTESRRLHKYSSELDLERALEESRLLEELRQQKAERDKLEAAANVEREAEVPTLLTEHEIELRNFKDTSLLRNAEESLRVFEFAPPEDTLTPEQSREFTKLWKKHPKMWHMIADALHLTTKECIYHYYATKWDKPYKGGKARKPKRPGLGNTRRGLIGARGRLEVDTDTPDTAVGLTETGRPRRAAAPVFSKPTMGKGGDLEAETDSPAPSGKRTAGNKTDNGITEGRGSGRGKVAKEKPARKPRNQPLVAKTSAVSSPQKVARERKDKAASVTPALTGEGEEWTGKRESVPPQERLMPILVPQQQQQQLQQPLLQTYPAEPPNMHMYREANSNLTPMDHTPGAPQIPVSQRSRSHSNTQKANASSYWSVTEETEFQACLIYYGTDFQQIAAHINKKTPVMVCT
jgi:serine/arginine repetitive matrix protein 2